MKQIFPQNEKRPLSEVKALVEQMSLKVSDDSYYFPWKDVFESMLEYHNNVQETEERCPHCWSQITRIWFCSPKRTWEGLMGRAGTMLICPHCVKQIGFDCYEMN